MNRLKKYMSLRKGLLAELSDFGVVHIASSACDMHGKGNPD